MKQIVLHGHKVVGGKAVSGEAIVTTEPLCFFPLMNRDTGVVTDTAHPLYGKSISGKILVYPTGKGSTGTSYAIYDMAGIRGTGPLALIMKTADPISTIGAIMGEVPVMDGFDGDIFELIEDGDLVEVDAGVGIITITKH